MRYPDQDSLSMASGIHLRGNTNTTGMNNHESLSLTVRCKKPAIPEKVQDGRLFQYY